MIVFEMGMTKNQRVKCALLGFTRLLFTRRNAVDSGGFRRRWKSYSGDEDLLVPLCVFSEGIPLIRSLFAGFQIWDILAVVIAHDCWRRRVRGLQGTVLSIVVKSSCHGLRWFHRSVVDSHSTDWN